MYSNLPKIILDIVDLIRNNNLKDNLSLVLMAANEDPNNIEHLFNLGVEYLEGERIVDILMIFGYFRSINSQDIRMLFNKAVINAMQF